ncbi:MAG: hypothetical protein JWN30_235, partial [Bacilli bacterium]|nr:hypothetical protein [Bacilli bacterium]
YLTGITHLNGTYAVNQPQHGFPIDSTIADNILALEQDYSFQLDNLNSTNAPNLSIKVDGQAVVDPATAILSYDSVNNDEVVQFKTGSSGNTPFSQGIHTVTLVDNTGTVIATFKINYVASPIIQIMNIANGEIITDTSTQLNEIHARFYNLTNTQIMATTVTLNGTQVQGSFPAPAAASNDSRFVPLSGTLADYMKANLKNGQNSLVITTTAAGPNNTSIPITVNLTLYQFATSNAKITVKGPWAYTQPQNQTGVPPVGNTNSPVKDLKTKLQGNTWVTTNGYIVFQAQFTTIQNFNVLVNGKSILPHQPTLTNADDPNWWVSNFSTTVNGSTASPNNLLKAAAVTGTGHDASYATDGSSWVWISNEDTVGANPTVFVGLLLPQTGNLDLTFMADNLKTQDVLISRQTLAYSIVNPADQPHYVNQNFYDVQLDAPQGSTVVIGKLPTNSTPSTTDQTRSIYDAVVTLKPGTNNIAFTVTTGSKTATGQLVIVDNNQNVIGAESRMPLSTSGTLTAFNGDLTLKFPKSTVFQTTDTVGQQTSSQPILLPTQNVLMGIADPGTGVLEYQYSNGQEVPYDGNNTLHSFSYHSDVFNSLHALGYNLTDNLYWIDPGYYDYSNAAAHDGIQPFLYGTEFFARNGVPNKLLYPSNSGTVSISYNPMMRNAASTTLCVMHFNPVTNTWDNLGGVVNTGNHTISAPYNDPGYYTVVYLQRTYDDITNHDWARNYMNAMLAKGIMLPAQPGTSFGANLNITRGEWAQVMVKALGLNLQYDINHPTFVDVPNTINGSALWDFRYVETAARSGIVFGEGDGAFVPGGYVSREDAAVMIARAMNLKVPGDDQDAKTLAALQKMYTDGSGISRYARGSVLAISQLGIITGNPNQTAAGSKTTYNFAPQGSLLRSEAAAIAYRVMQKLKELP